MDQILVALFYIFLSLASLIALIFLVWRFSSKRHALPCPQWLGWMVEKDNPFTKTNRAAVIIEHLNLSSGMHVLDAGCGPGRLTLPLAQAIGSKGKVVALDMQATMLAKTRKKVEDANLQNVDYLQARLGEGKLCENSFARIVLVTVLGEIPNPLIAFKELYKALKPGGILSVTEVIFDPHFQTQKKVLSLAHQAGFKEKALFGWSLAYTQHFEKL